MTDWALSERDGVTVVVCAPLLRARGVLHAFSTRRADAGDGFDLGGIDDTGEPFVARRGRLVRAAGLGGSPFAPRQVHGCELVTPGEAVADSDLPRADGVVARVGEGGARPAAVRTADCVPLLIADRRGRAVAAVHAGWRGTSAGIAERAVRRLASSGIDPVDLVAALGPAIGPCCYEVGGEVLAAVPGGEVPGTRHLDLHAANRRQLQACGIPRKSIHAAPWCTRCRPDLFWSYRRDGAATGRMMACIGWPDP